jgi:hypothetical protein
VLAGLRRRTAPLLLLGAGAGAYLAMGPKLPHDHDVTLDLGSAAADITSIDLSWTDPRSAASSSDEAVLTTRWNFAKGTAPSRLNARVRLADGRWQAEATIERSDGPKTTRWSGQVNLVGTPWWKRDNLGEGPVVLPVREAFR